MNDLVSKAGHLRSVRDPLHACATERPHDPTFRLFDIPLSKVDETAPSGQVTKVSDLSVQLPLPTGVRALGLKSSN